MKMNVSEFAKTSGVSVRTLHYYDEIGLLKPDFVDTENGYRFYGEAALLRMQEILFYRELDFSLKFIKDMLSSENYNKNEALKAQKELLLLKRARLDRIIGQLEDAEKGGSVMDFKAFGSEEINSYKEEVKARWGKTDAYTEQKRKTADYTKEKWNDVAAGFSQIIDEFALLKAAGEGAGGTKAKAAVGKLQGFITDTQYTCTNEILTALGEMYVTDERFKKNIDKAGKGTAEYIYETIKAYCE